MIIPSKDKADDSLLVDEPPSYDDVTRASHVAGDRKRPFVRALSRSTPTPGPSSARSPVSSSSTSSWLTRNILGTSSPKSTRPSEPPNPRSQADVRSTVLGLVRDLVASSSSTLGASLWSDNGLAAIGVLDSCVAVCERQQVSLASILQETSVEGHTPAYWAIIQRPPFADGQTDEALIKLLALSAPLTQYTIYELRLACLATHSNTMLQRIRTTPSIFPFSGTDCVLLQGSDVNPPSRGFRDVIDVVEGGGREVNEGAFSVKLELEMFQRRMRVSNEVQVEFIARGRIWSLIFFIVPASLPHPYLERKDNDASQIPPAAYTALRMLPKSLAPGTWACCLSLRAGSPECWVDGRIMVREPDPATAYLSRNDASMQESMQKPLPSLHPPTMSVTEFGHARTHSQPEFINQSPSRNPYNSSLVNLPGTSSSAGRFAHPSGIPAFTMPPDVNPFRSVLSSPSAHLSPPPQHPLRSSPSTPSLVSSFSPSNFSSAGSKLALMSTKSWKPPRTLSGSKPPLTLRLKCTQGPLIAPPPPPCTSLPLSLIPSSPLVTNTLDEGEKSKKIARRERKQAKKEAKAKAAKEKRAREGKETKKEKAELGEEAHTVVLVGLGEGMDGKGEGKGGMGKLMYDGCSYVAHDGTLRATFEAKLGKPESECIIC